jgi:hypothetical protein
MQRVRKVEKMRGAIAMFDRPMTPPYPGVPKGTKNMPLHKDLKNNS